jgi:hypothetical protein
MIARMLIRENDRQKNTPSAKDKGRQGIQNPERFRTFTLRGGI